MNPNRALARLASRRGIVSTLTPRHFSSSTRILFKQETDAVTPQSKDPQREHPNAEEFREAQKSRPLNPHMTNTTSAEHNEKGVPKIGKDKPPPELLTSVDGQYTPKDRKPENTDRMTGGTQPGDPDNVSSSEFGVGEMEGAAFKVEPLRRYGEDAITIRARLLCPSTPLLRIATCPATFANIR